MSRHGAQSSQCHRGDRLLRTRKESPNIRSEALAKEKEEEEEEEAEEGVGEKGGPVTTSLGTWMKDTTL